MMLFMVVENFKDAAAVFQRFREKGRLAPEGVNYVSSWVDAKFEKCFQLMEAESEKLLGEWTANWSDIVDFEIFPVMSSKEAAEKIAE